jgi:signal peptidase I
VGDLTIGAHSGIGDPEESATRTVESVDDIGRGDADNDQPPGAAEDPHQDGAHDVDRTDEASGKEQQESSPAPSEADRESGDGGGAAAKDKKPRSFWKELPILVVVALVLALLIKTFLVQAFSIPSGSMENTLLVGDRVLVDKLTPHFGDKPSRGEVVVFHDPSDWLDGEPGQQPSSNSVVRGVQDVLGWIGLMPSANEKDLIKRVIAVGGDTISCNGTGPVYVNGKPLTEPYIYPGATPCGDKNFGPLKVPANSIWVMGDHRNNSSDSRYHMDEPGGGAVPDKDVVGRAIVVAWPISHWSTLPIPSTFTQSGITTQADAPAAAPVSGTSPAGTVGAALVREPAAAGLIGAIPLTYLNRRLRLRRTRRSPRRSGGSPTWPDR